MSKIEALRHANLQLTHAAVNLTTSCVWLVLMKHLFPIPAPQSSYDNSVNVALCNANISLHNYRPSAHSTMNTQAGEASITST